MYNFIFILQNDFMVYSNVFVHARKITVLILLLTKTFCISQICYILDSYLLFYEGWEFIDGHKTIKFSMNRHDEDMLEDEARNEGMKKL